MILGIDPGKNGGWAILEKAGQIVNRGHRSEIEGIKEYPLGEIKIVCLEKVSGWTGEDPRKRHNIQKLVEDFGFWQGFLLGLGLPEPHLIHPITWRSYYGLKGTTKIGGKSQQPSPVVFVNAVWKMVPPLKMKEDGMAVAILLASMGLKWLK